MTIVVELSYRYQPIINSIGLLHEEIGPNFLEVIVKPEIRSATREVIGKYLPEELYSTKREAIQTEILDRTRLNVDKKHLILDQVLIREVALPASLKVAIEKKLEEEQLSFQFEFKLDRERKEAKRKIIEATAKRVGVSPEKVMMNIQRYGNTTSATLPLLLADYENQLKKGDNLIFAAFGGGFTWGAIYLKWAYNS